MIKKLRKRFGQHLLSDKSSIVNIVQAINPSPETNLCEIGPGLGAITIPILKKIGHMHAVEIDRDLGHELKKKCMPHGTLELHQTDILKFNITNIASKETPIRLVGNLPYNISTPLLFHVLKFAEIIIDMHFLLQKEVVDRITAQAGNSNYSRLSVMAQSYCEVEKLFDISPSMFTPPPKVESSFMRLIPNDLNENKIIDRKIFNKVVETAFHQRRKTIKNSLSNLLSSEYLQNANIDPGQRPQEISIPQFIQLANQLCSE